jgi:Ca2+-binding RTX toxin-like protein
MAHRLVAICCSFLLVLGPTIVLVDATAARAGVVPCELDSKAGELKVVLDHDNVRLSLRGRDILVDRRSCGATVKNIDSVRVIGGNMANFSFRKGFLAPGRTPETNGSSEIEIDLEDFRGTIWMHTPAGNDTIVAGSRGVDLNDDGDADLIGGAIRGMGFLTRGGSDEVSTLGRRGTGRPVPDIRVRVDAGPGRDRVTFGAGQDALLFGGRGNDRVVSSDAEFGFFVGGAGNDVFIGGPGKESFYPGFGADVVRAMGGNDVVSQLEKGDESDVFSGGSGSDGLIYGGEQVSGRFSVSFDGIANDGLPGEGDDVASDFEMVWGSNGRDTLVGGDRDNTFFGGAGNDDITGGGGRDRLFGGPGDDEFHTVDGGADRIWGGKQEDTAIDRDDVDRVRDVEIL